MANIIFQLCLILACLIISRNYLHFFQLDSYQYPSFYRTIKRNKRIVFLPIFFLFFLCFIFDLINYLNYSVIFNNIIISLVCSIALLVLSTIVRNKYKIKNIKKPLVLTSRVKRLYSFYIISVIIFTYINTEYIYISVVPLFLIPIFLLSGLLDWPLEKFISELYFRDARKRLTSQNNTIRVGITGSYGKTTVKVILNDMLNSMIPTLKTPRSFNTPMGITRTIREKLLPSHRIFLAEMGSRHIGDIKELCRLVQPQIGIISSVGPQHLDTFKTVERVAKGKYELIESLPQDGHAFFQDDKSICSDFYKKTDISKTLVSIYDKNADVYADNITVSKKGSNFRLNIKGKESVECTTQLLGEHNIKNIILCAAVCDYFDMDVNQIKFCISSIKPIKNRLEIINAHKYTIINDAFNSNPVGAKAALKVLKGFDNRKIVITPGMVELGNMEEKLNKIFGQQLSESADIVILVGNKRIKPIKDGLLENNFNENNIYVVQSLNESTILLNKIVLENDIVLYENDLPDNYIEA